MSLKQYQVSSAINYNNKRGYSQKAIGIIQMFANARTTGYFDEQTIQSIYRAQTSPYYPKFKNGGDGKVGPATLGLIILELEHVNRMSEAALLRSYNFTMDFGKVPEPVKKEESPEAEEKTDPKDKDRPRQVRLDELRHIWTGPGTIPHPWGGGTITVGNLYLATEDIRKVIGLAYNDIYYIVVKTASDVLDQFNVGKIYKQTKRGFCSDIDWAALPQVGRSAKGGMEMAKKEVELLMGAVFAGVGAFGGFAALTAGAMQFLVMNNEEIFKIVRAFEQLMKVKDVLSANTPEFWQLCKTVLRLSVSKTPEALWSDPYAAVKIVGELVMIVGEAVLLKQIKSFGVITKLAGKLMTGLFGKLADAATLALDQKNLAAAIKEADPTLDQAKIDKIIKELKDNWKIVEPALKAIKAAIDQLVGA